MNQKDQTVRTRAVADARKEWTLAQVQELCWAAQEMGMPPFTPMLIDSKTIDKGSEGMIHKVTLGFHFTEVIT